MVFSPYPVSGMVMKIDSAINFGFYGTQRSTAAVNSENTFTMLILSF